MSRLRVAAVLTHPVQYYAAWFRWMHANCPEIDLRVIYASRPTAAQQGIGFERAFAWDVPLTEGYVCTVVREARDGDRFDAARFYGLNVRGIGEAISNEKPDVVIVFGWYSITLVRAVRAARRMGVPVVYHGDTNLQSAPDGWRRLLWIAKTRRLLRQFDGYLSVGTRSSAFLRFFDVGDDRIFAAPHAVDVEHFGQGVVLRRSTERPALRRTLGLPENAFIVLAAGKLEPKKRPLDVVAAIAQMKTPAHLAVAGSGPLESDVRRACESAGVGVSMLGFVNQTDLPRVYAASDCLVLSSDARETWGLVVNEALAAGLPCIVADSAGCAPDLGNEETGARYATADAAERPVHLAEAIDRVRDRLQRGHDFAPACATASARHSFATAAAGLVRACQSVTRRAARPRGDRAPRIVAPCGSMVLVGGLERMTFEILGVARERGAAVHCVTNWWDNGRIIAMAERVGASWSTGFYTYRFTRHVNGPLVAGRILWDIVRTSGDLLRDAMAFRPSHVFVSDYVTVARNAPALALLRLTGRRIILRLGNAPDRGRAYRLIWRIAVAPFVDVFICNSPFTDRELAAHGIPARKRMTIAHTSPTRSGATTSSARDSQRLIYVGQIIPEKGLDVLLEATALLVHRGHDVRLDVVGRIDGWVPPAHEPYREGVLSRARRPDLADRVRFLGFREDVPALMAQASIHCCPSRREQREAFGIVVIEAKAAGIPSVVFPSGNLPDLIAHGDDGWVCRDETAGALADGIEQFLDPHALARAMACAKASADAFSRDKFENSWTQVFAGGAS